MTKEEAITRIKDHIEIHRYHERNAVKIFEALDMAIKSLEQPEPYQEEDAVSRENAIRWVKTECNPYGKPTLDFESGKKVIEYLKRMSPVTPRRKMGKWIQNDNGTYSCSLCHSWIPEEQHYYAQYCLYCGADMRGEKI